MDSAAPSESPMTRRDMIRNAAVLGISSLAGGSAFAETESGVVGRL